MMRGLIPVLPTPFTPDGSLDLSSFEKIIDYSVASGADAITTFGVASEFYKLSDEERRQLVQSLVSSTNKRVKTVVSITQHATKLAVREAVWAQEQGVDALMLLPPFFLNPSSESILKHTHSVIEAVDIPVILQYAPAETGQTIAPDVFVALQESVGRPISIKVETQPPGPYVSKLLERSNREINVLVGNGGRHLFDCLLRGATGVMPGISFLGVYRVFLDRFLEGDHTTAFGVYNALVSFLNIAGGSAERFIYYEKMILQLRGVLPEVGVREPAFKPDSIEEGMVRRYISLLQDFEGSVVLKKV